MFASFLIFNSLLNIQTRVVDCNLKGEGVRKISQVKSDERYGYKPLSDGSEQRLDVNNLLNRIKIEILRLSEIKKFTANNADANYMLIITN